MAQTDAVALRFQAKTTSIMALANVFGSLVLVRHLGVAGPVWASAASLLFLHALPLILRARRRAALESAPSPTGGY
jgi:hypothetical protein